MSKQDDGGPAFPVPTINGHDFSVDYPPYVRGMTLLDWFAGRASESDIENHKALLVHRGVSSLPSREQAKYAYADAMLAARKETR